MNTIKKFLGLIWIILAPVSMVFLVLQAIEKVGLCHTEIERTNTILQWAIILLIFLPISLGLVIFGWYGWKGEYAKVSENHKAQ